MWRYRIDPDMGSTPMKAVSAAIGAMWRRSLAIESPVAAGRFKQLDRALHDGFGGIVGLHEQSLDLITGQRLDLQLQFGRLGDEIEVLQRRLERPAQRSDPVGRHPRRRGER